MKYRTSQIISRSKDLADIQNTDFLTHEEQTRYLNDSWTTVLQWLINKGDTQFVNEVILQPSGFGAITEYEIPFDLYRIKSIKNAVTGSPIMRASVSDGINSNTYEVVNNTIRLYGVANTPILLTYYLKPLFLTFPDKDIEVALAQDIVSAAGNSVLLEDGTIKNLLTGEIVGAVTLDDTKRYKLGNGHIAELYDTEAVLTNTWTDGQNHYDADLTPMDVPAGEVITRRIISNPSGITVSNNGSFYIKSNSTGTYEVRENTIIIIEAGGSEDVYSSDFVSPIDAFYSTWTPIKGGNLGSYYTYADKYYKKVEDSENPGSFLYYEVLSRTSDAESLDPTAVSDQTIIDNLDSSDAVTFYRCLWHKDYHGYWTVTGFTTTAINKASTVINPALGIDNPTAEEKALFELLDDLESEEAATIAYLEYRLAAGEYLTYYNFNGKKLYETSLADGTFSLIYDHEFNILYQKLIDGAYSNSYFMQRQVTKYTDEVPQFIQEIYYVSDNKLMRDGVVMLEFNGYTPSEIIPTDDWDNSPAFIIRTSDDAYRVWAVHNDEFVEDIELDITEPISEALLKYGPLVSNGTNLTVKSHIPDTEMNFPNNIYFSLLSCDLALRYAMKMNAEYSGLQNLYLNMQTTFMSSLSQAGSYLHPRDVL